MMNKTDINCCYNTKAMDHLADIKIERAKLLWRDYSVSMFSMKMKNGDIAKYHHMLEKTINDGNDYMMFGVPLYRDMYNVWTLIIANGDRAKSWIELNIFKPIIEKRMADKVSDIAYARKSNTVTNEYNDEDEAIRMLVCSFKEKHFGSSPLSRIYHKINEPINDRSYGQWMTKEFASIERSGCLRFFGDEIKDGGKFGFIKKGTRVAISVLSGHGDLYLDFEDLKPKKEVPRSNKNDQFITYELEFSKKGTNFILPTAELFKACGLDYKNYYYTYCTVHVGGRYVFKPIVRKR